MACVCIRDEPRCHFLGVVRLLQGFRYAIAFDVETQSDKRHFRRWSLGGGGEVNRVASRLCGSINHRRGASGARSLFFFKSKRSTISASGQPAKTGRTVLLFARSLVLRRNQRGQNIRRVCRLLLQPHVRVAATLAPRFLFDLPEFIRCAAFPPPPPFCLKVFSFVLSFCFWLICQTVVFGSLASYNVRHAVCFLVFFHLLETLYFAGPNCGPGAICGPTIHFQRPAT